MKTGTQYAIWWNNTQYVRFVVNILQETKTTETIRVSWVDVKTNMATLGIVGLRSLVLK
jgi:hypothetical protein